MKRSCLYFKWANAPKPTAILCKRTSDWGVSVSVLNKRRQIGNHISVNLGEGGRERFWINWRFEGEISWRVSSSLSLMQRLFICIILWRFILRTQVLMCCTLLYSILIFVVHRTCSHFTLDFDLNLSDQIPIQIMAFCSPKGETILSDSNGCGIEMPSGLTEGELSAQILSPFHLRRAVSVGHCNVKQQNGSSCLVHLIV